MFKIVQQARPNQTSSIIHSLLNSSCYNVNGLNGPISALPAASLNNLEVRRFARNTKPWNIGPMRLIKKGVITYEYKRLRGKKVAKVELPNFDDAKVDLMKLTPEEVRSKLKQRGIVPHREWDEKPISSTTSMTIFEPYTPPAGDGKISVLSRVSQKQMDIFTEKGKNILTLRKIRKYFPDFKAEVFANEAFQILQEANKALIDIDMDKLHDNATEFIIPSMLENLTLKTIRWQMLGSLEPPRVVYMRSSQGPTPGSIFAQITVRFHTQQTLAVYDRFGRLVHGDEAVVKDVLEYIVFERQLTEEYGKWRVHAKILPEDFQVSSESIITCVKSKNDDAKEINDAQQ